MFNCLMQYFSVNFLSSNKNLTPTALKYLYKVRLANQTHVKAISKQKPAKNFTIPVTIL